MSSAGIEGFPEVCCLNATRADILRDGLVQARARLLPHIWTLEGVGSLLCAIDRALSLVNRGHADGVAEVEACLRESGEAFVLVDRQPFVLDVVAVRGRAADYELRIANVMSRGMKD